MWGARPPVAPPRAIATWPWPRRYAILRIETVVGYTDLEFAIARGRRAAGFMVPAEGYEGVRHIFRLYNEAGNNQEKLRQYVDQRDTLALVITDGGTLPLAASVELLGEWTPTRVVAPVAVRDERYWNLRLRS